ncbi:MAG: hypothetical protein QMD95_00230 [Candidatus Hodarchaeaceae archaeon]|nr:hypothetical protein [Candidatus Hodarchaeaceae archaeon]
MYKEKYTSLPPLRSTLILITAIAAVIMLLVSGHASAWVHYDSHLEISSDARFIVASFTVSQGFCLFSREDNQPLWSYETLMGCMSISDNGDYIAAGASNALYLFSNQDNQPLWSYSEYIAYVGISSDGTYIVASTFFNVLTFSKENNTPLWSIFLVFEPPVAISAGGDYVVARGIKDRNEELILLNRETGTPLWIYNRGRVPDTPIREVSYFPWFWCILLVVLMSIGVQLLIWQRRRRF